MLGYQAEVAPVNLRDINIIQDGKLTREWKLWKHNDNLCYDEKEGAVARAVQPLWLIDNHIEWKTINKDQYFQQSRHSIRRPLLPYSM